MSNLVGKTVTVYERWIMNKYYVICALIFCSIVNGCALFGATHTLVNTVTSVTNNQTQTNGTQLSSIEQDTRSACQKSFISCVNYRAWTGGDFYKSYDGYREYYKVYLKQLSEYNEKLNSLKPKTIVPDGSLTCQEYKEQERIDIERKFIKKYGDHREGTKGYRQIKCLYWGTEYQDQCARTKAQAEYDDLYFDVVENFDFDQSKYAICAYETELQEYHRYKNSGILYKLDYNLKSKRSDLRHSYDYHVRIDNAKNIQELTDIVTTYESDPIDQYADTYLKAKSILNDYKVMTDSYSYLFSDVNSFLFLPFEDIVDIAENSVKIDSLFSK